MERGVCTAWGSRCGDKQVGGPRMYRWTRPPAFPFLNGHGRNEVAAPGLAQDAESVNENSLRGALMSLVRRPFVTFPDLALSQWTGHVTQVAPHLWLSGLRPKYPSLCEDSSSPGVIWLPGEVLVLGWMSRKPMQGVFPSSVCSFSRGL